MGVGRGEPLPTSSGLGKAESALSWPEDGKQRDRGVAIGPLAHCILLFHVTLKKLNETFSKGKEN